jgi:hypothetical protein
MRKIKTVDCPQQTKVAFFDNIRKPKPATNVLLGDIDDKPQIAADKSLARFRIVMLNDPRRQFDFFLRFKQR